MTTNGGVANVTVPSLQLQSQLPTFRTASSSLSSAEFEVPAKSSVEADGKICPDVGEGQFFRKCTVVMSSECVEP